MKTFIGRTLSAQGRVTISDTPLGKGGEGSVYEVTSHDFASGLPPAASLVAKIYHDPNEGDRQRKVAAMIKSPPDSDSVAWPLAMIHFENQRFAGYLMIKLSSKSFRQWSELSNTKDRRGTSSQFDVRYALTACRNLAVALDSVHAAGHRAGDVNESNIFIGSDASVLIVDTDSAQIQNTDGSVFPCLVGKPEYTAAELSRGSLRNQTRTIESDVFAYSVAMFQMLTGGSHPTDGIFTGEGDAPSTVDKIRVGVLPGLDPRNARGMKSLPRIPVSGIPKAFRGVLVDSLSPDPTRRSSLSEFVRIFDEVLGNLQQCSVMSQHWFDSRDGQCGWCVHANDTQSDPWAPKGLPRAKPATQATLPSVSFENNSGPAPVRRAAPAVAGQQAAQAHAAAGGQSTVTTSNNALNNSATQTPQSTSVPNVSQSNPNQSAAGNQQQFNQPQQQPEAPAPKHPKKYKGKVILDYADGTWNVRPPIAQLMKSNPKVAIHCIKEETPVFAKAWWETSRPVAVIWGLLIGLIVALGMSVAWLFVLPMTAPFLPEVAWIPTALKYFSYAAVVTSTLASLWLFFSSLNDMRSAKKQYGSLERVKREKIWKTSIRFLPIPLVYGPILLIILIGMGLSALIDALTSGVKR